MTLVPHLTSDECRRRELLAPAHQPRVRPSTKGIFLYVAGVVLTALVFQLPRTRAMWMPLLGIDLFALYLHVRYRRPWKVCGRQR